MDDKQLRSLFILLHRIFVLLDDWICDQSPAAPLSRRARGKYAEE